MIRLFKNVCLFVFFSLCLSGCESQLDMKEFQIVYECLYDETNKVLENKEKPY